MNEIYFDNSATTFVFPEVREIVSRCMEEDYGNPASLHKKGMDAEKYVKTAKEQIAKTLRCEPKNIYFTSGGTESNNWALIGAARALHRQGNHLITTVVEHASIKNPMKYLEEEGFEVTYLPVDEFGCTSVAELEKALRPDTILVSVMYVNNEIGAVEPIEELGAYLHANRPEIYFHVDAI